MPLKGRLSYENRGLGSGYLKFLGDSRILIWILIIVGLLVLMYFGGQQKIEVKFLPSKDPVPRQINRQTDSDIHDAVNFVK